MRGLRDRQKRLRQREERLREREEKDSEGEEEKEREKGERETGWRAGRAGQERERSDHIGMITCIWPLLVGD
jgi:hypothetical protein